MRTVVGYIPSGYLNSAASATVTGSTDAETTIPINTGLSLGSFREIDDVQVLPYSNQGVMALNILTAGSGQTPGTYSVTASAGGAVASITVAAGGTVTAQPIITTRGGPYTDTAVPTFTLAAGGTPATFQASIGVLYSGNYQWVQLDPLYAGANILPGQPLWYVEGTNNLVVTPTSAASNLYDWAGTNIDPNFGPSLPYAFVQVGPGMHRVLIGSGQAATVNTYGLTLSTAGVTTYIAAAIAGLLPYSYVGMPISTIPVSSTGLARITRSLARF
jgi:hypothetical protein